MKTWTKQSRSRRMAGAMWLVLLAGMSGAVPVHSADAPVLSAPIFGIAPTAAQLALTNCGDTNFQYVVQTSTDLTNWTPVTTNFATGPGSPVTVPATNPSCFYRVMEIPHVPAPLFQWAIMTISNFHSIGNFVTVDSYDSSSPLYSTIGQYDPTKRRAGGNVASASPIVGAVAPGNGNIYGHVMTGPGTQSNAIQVGPAGAVGDLAWNATSSGLEPGFWSGNFFVNFPDATPPPIGNPTLPVPDSNGVVNLSGGYYAIPAGDPNLARPLNVTGATTLWVQGSYSPAGITIAGTNNAKLCLYVGRTTGSGDSSTLGGDGPLNSPGFPVNLQIYGLPSLTTIFVRGNSAFGGTIYAPEADVSCTGSGNNTMDTSGAIIAKSITMSGHTNFHYDENLLVNGPVF